MDIDTIARRVVSRYLTVSRSYAKETKEHKAEKLAQRIRNATGLSKGVSEAIADAIVRGRDVLRLAIQKSWPVSEDGIIEGPSGSLSLTQIAT
jgi:hypothetical protein